MEAQMQAISAQLQQLTQQNQELLNRLQAAETAAATAAAESSKGGGKGQGAANFAIDTRVLGRPEFLQGDDKQWLEWAPVMKAYAGIIHPRMRDLFALAEEGDEECENLFIEDTLQQASGTLYYILVMLVCKKQRSLLRTPALGKEHLRGGG